MTMKVDSVISKIYSKSIRDINVLIYARGGVVTRSLDTTYGKIKNSKCGNGDYKNKVRIL